MATHTELERTVRQQARVLRTLGSEPRLKILRLLREHPQCVSAIAARLHMTQPAVSQHLHLLRDVGLVKAVRRGTWIHYTVRSDALESYGKGMAAVFGGWVELAKPSDGTSGCPAALLGECHKDRPARKAGRRGKA
jgi:ArsR family transcriptional regulator, arsenate/arsenite/antimonite-responsive transcriptional repressor